MSRIGLRPPSPSMVVALIALFVALGGSAVALSGRNTVFSDDIVPQNVKTSDLKDGAVTTPKLAEAARGARAYGSVDSSSCAIGPLPQTCQVHASKGISSVTRNYATGGYCLTVPGVDAAQTAAVVAVNYGATDGPEGNAVAEIGEGSYSNCPAQSFQVFTLRHPSTTVSGTEVVQTANEANDVGFNIVVP